MEFASWRCCYERQFRGNWLEQKLTLHPKLNVWAWLWTRIVIKLRVVYKTENCYSLSSSFLFAPKKCCCSESCFASSPSTILSCSNAQLVCRFRLIFTAIFSALSVNIEHFVVSFILSSLVRPNQTLTEWMFWDAWQNFLKSTLTDFTSSKRIS